MNISRQQQQQSIHNEDEDDMRKKLSDRSLSSEVEMKKNDKNGFIKRSVPPPLPSPNDDESSNESKENSENKSKNNKKNLFDAVEISEESIKKYNLLFKPENDDDDFYEESSSDKNRINFKPN